MDQPFDILANDYDAVFTKSEIGVLQRQRVYYYLKPLFDNENMSHVLELNCGTGEDALWLSKKGCSVLATDVSASMIEIANHKRMQIPDDEKGQLAFRVLDMQELENLESLQPFDTVFSNFGGLNCIAPDKLPALAKSISGQLKSGGYFVGVIMGKFCWWESLYFLLKRNWKQAWRRGQHNPIKAPLSDGSTIDTWYFSPKEFAKYFSKNFELIEIYPVGFTIPPSYLDPLFKRWPLTLKFLHLLERFFGKWSWPAKLADHYFIALKKKAN